jgi:DNA repair protein RadC
MGSHSIKVDLIKQLMALEAIEGAIKISKPENILPYINKYRNRKQEEFIVITLNGGHEVIKVRTVTKGILNRTLIHPREVYRMAIKDNAAAIILAHNHPSGNYEPSKEDREITIRMKKAGEIIGIEVLDHVIIARKGYYSFLEEGQLDV